MKAKTSLSILLTGAVGAALAQQSSGQPPTVTITNGTVQGARCPSTDVNAFLGIPYAQAPVGALRFAPPRPYNQTFAGGTLNATRPPPACIQFNAAFAEAGAQSEDCLFIDVWAPANASTAQPLPVKVWLYGGANEAGGISNPTYDGCTAVSTPSSPPSQQQVIQVSINYRVGPLGYLASAPLGLRGNQGTRDQLLALRWVRDEIAAFGGDPARVLLFGQSAGALDALVLSSLPQARDLGIMRAVVLQSSPGATLARADDDAVQNGSAAFVAALGCSGAAADLACAQAANVSAVAAAYTAVGGTSSNPVVDGEVVAAQPLEAGLKVPAVAGSTTQEGTLFLLAGLGAGVAQVNATTYNTYLTATYGSRAGLVNETYPLSKYAGAAVPALAAMTDLITHQTFRCPARAFLRAAAEGGMPVWTYSFNHTPTCPWYPTIPAGALSLLGATHTAEIPFVFGGTDDMPRPGGNCSLTAGERALSATMLAAWDGMAAEGNPGAADFWPRYNASGSMGVNVVGDDFAAGVVDYSMCDFWDSFDNITMTSGGGGGGSGTTTSGGPAVLLGSRSWSAMAWASLAAAALLAFVGM